MIKMATSRCASIAPEMDNWLKEREINFSGFVRDKIIEEMRKEVSKIQIERSKDTRIDFLESRLKKMTIFIEHEGLLEKWLNPNGNKISDTID